MQRISVAITTSKDGLLVVAEIVNDEFLLFFKGMAKEVTLWNKVMSSALKLPGVAVDREEFLRSRLSPFCCGSHINKALAEGTAGVVPSKILDKIATECIRSHSGKVAMTSAAMGVPGGWAMIGTVPADIAQFYYHVFVLGQKLAYIYGFPDLRDEKGHLTPSAINLLTLFVGVMTGVGIAVKAVEELGKMMQKQIVKKLPEYALSQGALAPVVRQVAKWIGVSLSKDSVAEGLTKAVPIISGAVSGVMTYASFKPQAKRLKRNLHTTMLLPAHNTPMLPPPPEEIPYEEVPPSE